jgi:hypothetical protein
MGLVVEFGVPMVRPRRRKSERPCEITIFPGVRYERYDADRDGKRPPEQKRGSAVAPLESEKA